MTGLTRGRLPARVYWVRRLMVLGIAMLLVVGIARLLGGSSDGSSGPDRATQVADTGAPSIGATSGSTDGTTPGTGQQPSTGGHPQPGNRKTPLVQPSGPCSPDDVAVTPSVPHPVAGQDVTVVLDLSTVTEPACTWTLSGQTLAMKISRGSKLIWTTVQCARDIAAQDLVLRNTAPTKVQLTWDARRSEPGCPEQTEWALPGSYRIHVAALAGKPQVASFELTAPPPAEVTQTATPHQHATQGEPKQGEPKQGEPSRGEPSQGQSGTGAPKQGKQHQG